MDSARVVTGWCELRKAFRFFRTDRISSAEICDRYPARRADLIRDFYVQLSDEHSEARSPDRKLTMGDIHRARPKRTWVSTKRGGARYV